MGGSGDSGGNTQPGHSENLRDLASRSDDSSTQRRGTASKKESKVHQQEQISAYANDNAPANPYDEGKEVEKFIKDLKAKLMEENDFVPEVLKSLKDKEFKTTKHRIEFCSDVLDEIRLEEYPETEEFATQWEHFLDSFGYFPPSLRDSYRSWLKEYRDHAKLNQENGMPPEELLKKLREALAISKKENVIGHTKFILCEMARSNTWSELQALSRFGYEAGGGTTTATGPTAEYVADNIEPNRVRGGCLPSVDEIKCNNYGLLSKQGGWTVQNFNELSTKSLTQEETDKLKSIASLFDNWLANANVSTKTEDKLKMEMNKATKSLESEAAIEAVENNASNSYFRKIQCPPMIAQEVNGTQPAMMWLLNRISGVAGNSNSAETRLPVDLKPILRKNQNPAQVENECKNQIIGHLSKILCNCFNHHCVGISSYVTGVVSTLAYVKVIQLHLIMGSADKYGDGVSKLIFSESKYLPLISKSTFKHWMEHHGKRLTKKQQKNLGKLKLKLYHDEEDDGAWDIPPGILALYEHARKPHDSFFGPKFAKFYRLVEDSDPSSEKPTVLGALLGRGTFGVVIKAEKGGRKYALKIALSRHKHIQNEKLILNELGQNRKSGSLNEFLPILEKELELNLELGSYKKQVAALLLSPRGNPFLYHLSQVEASQLLEYATLVRNNVTEALNHVHQRGYLHNDISPKNMIVVSPQEEDQQIKICLVDFGGASKIDHGSKSKYQIGTTAFMHKERLDMTLYKKSGGWEHKESHDFFGLYLSCAAILHREHPGHPSWDMTDYNKKGNLDMVLLERRDQAIAILDTYHSSDQEVLVKELKEKIQSGEQIGIKEANKRGRKQSSVGDLPRRSKRIATRSSTRASP